ncbi:hypothetical protein GWC95_11195 [Sediminibacterium roseum]|uniref:Uncharacterized protein n=1 Tax=Sediminibacterium roseum TaxID=1978412 RepID=A0ABW9ZTP1_9BACT|nr:hypothetical protein [Sediminibacterium roseum]NCI50491.1 hypothetical protein [Sediminibacterium roseum]
MLLYELIVFLIFSVVYAPFSVQLNQLIFLFLILFFLYQDKSRTYRCIWRFAVFCVASLILWNWISYNRASDDWETATLWAMSDPKTAEQYFRNAEPILHANRNFAKSHLDNLFALDSAVALKFIASDKNLNQYQANLLLGKIYGQRKDYTRSIYHLKLAHNIIPNRFIPLYDLMTIFKERKDSAGQKYYDSLILNTPVKIPSNAVNYIKQKALEKN